MAGRKPLLTIVKKSKGTLRKDRENKHEPKPPLALPIVPEFLPPRAQYWFGMISAWLQAMQIASPVYTIDQMDLAITCATIEKLTKQLETEGENYFQIRFQEDPYGKVMLDPAGKPLHVKIRKAHPAYAQRSEAMRHAQSLCASLGLSPTAKQKVIGTSENKTEDGWAVLAHG